MNQCTQDSEVAFNYRKEVTKQYLHRGIAKCCPILSKHSANRHLCSYSQLNLSTFPFATPVSAYRSLTFRSRKQRKQS